MKKFFLLITFLATFAIDANADIVDGFFFKPYFSLEYSAPKIRGDNYHTKTIGNQIKNFENIAIGGHVRIHKFFGLNANVYQTTLNAESFQHSPVIQKTEFALRQYNLSGTAYAPVINDLFEIFLELGVAITENNLSYQKSGENSHQSSDSRNLGFYGLGFQITPFDDNDDAIRFSLQRYQNLALIKSNYQVVRIGYLFSF